MFTIINQNNNDYEHNIQTSQTFIPLCEDQIPDILLETLYKYNIILKYKSFWRNFIQMKHKEDELSF